MALVARVFVTPRKDVLDPQGSTVAAALHALGFDEVGDVRVGRFLVLQVDTDDLPAARQRVDAMCRKLLANPIVEDYRVELEPVGAVAAAAGGAGESATETDR